MLMRRGTRMARHRVRRTSAVREPGRICDARALTAAPAVAMPARARQIADRERTGDNARRVRDGGFGVCGPGTRRTTAGAMRNPGTQT